MGAPAARVSELAQHWRRAGHDVTVLTGFPNHPTGEVVPEYRRHFRRLFMREQLAGVDVVRTWLLPLPNRKPYERILNYSSFAVSSAISGLTLARPDVVIATSPQLMVGLSGCWLARCKRVPFVFEVRDLWPESLAAVGVGSEHCLLHRSLRRAARLLYKHSKHIVVVTPEFKKHLISHWRVPAGKISVVENGVETNLFTPRPASGGLRKRLGAEGKFLVSYVGTIGMAHGLETLLEAAQKLQVTAPDVLFVLLGEGAEKLALKNEAEIRGLANVIFLDQRPREEIPEFIAASDAGLVLLKRTEIFKTVVPTKMLEFMSCAKPVILGVDGCARQILDRARAGIAIEPGNAIQLSEAILQLAADDRRYELLGQNGRRYVVEHCSRQKTAAEYLSVLEALLKPTRAEAAAA